MRPIKPVAFVAMAVETTFFAAVCIDHDGRSGMFVVCKERNDALEFKRFIETRCLVGLDVHSDHLVFNRIINDVGTVTPSTLFNYRQLTEAVDGHAVLYSPSSGKFMSLEITDGMRKVVSDHSHAIEPYDYLDIRGLNMFGTPGIETLAVGHNMKIVEDPTGIAVDRKDVLRRLMFEAQVLEAHYRASESTLREMMVDGMKRSTGKSKSKVKVHELKCRGFVDSSVEQVHSPDLQEALV